MLHRLMLAALVLLGTAAITHASDVVDVYRADGCSCCGKWAEHLKQNGFDVRMHNLASRPLSQLKTAAGISDRHASCHTAKVGGYVIEGHVPAADVVRLLKERPQAVGLSVPGMPMGSPGMEADGASEPYQVLLIRKDGSADTFASH